MKRPLLLSLLIIVFVALPAESASTFRAGAAASNITPPLGTLRSGSFAPYPTTHVNDELHARCLVLDNGNTTLALVVCDLVGFHRSVSVEARRMIEEHCGIPPENVVISANHTHSAGTAMGTTRYTNEQELDDYQKFVARRIADGVRRAKNLLRPAEIAFGKADAGANVRSRRWHLAKGKERIDHFGRTNYVWKTAVPTANYTKPAGPVDPYVYFIALREPGGAPISLYSAYSVHYVGDTGPAHISADYFGFYCDNLARRLGSPEQDPPFVAMMANSTSGDIGPNHDIWPKPTMPRGNYERPRFYAQDLADRVEKALKKVEWQKSPRLDVRFREVEFAWRKVEPELLDWAKDIEKRAPRLKEGNLPIGARWATTRPFVAPLSYAGRLQALANVSEPAKVPLQILRIGDVCIGTTPCETYTEIGLAFQKRSPFKNTFMVELNHGYIGYLPTPRHFKLGGYSTWPGTNYLEPLASEKIIDQLIEMAKEL
ncbi:MAG: neutral/alkaline non-lysosomal ceramidase N-terminal domain-containing protein [Limisphaerales bacterium]